MSLPLFDEVPVGPRRVSLIRLAGEIARNLAAVGPVAVEGEVYRPKASAGGAVFFDLRDRVAQISVRIPARVARRYMPVAGERVSVAGSLQWSNERGQVQLVADEVTPVGEGAVAALIERVRAMLEREGLLGPESRRRPIPLLPAVVGVVCGTEAAVRKDIESVVSARCPGYPVVFHETTVSGPGASVSIVSSIQSLARRPGVEVIILARGGGDAPSLLPWSHEDVCRAVAACPVPVVSAIGHESDRPLCDEVADLRCGTPSLAATRVLPDLAALSAGADALLERAAVGVGSVLEAAARRVEAVDVRRAVDSGVLVAAGRLERAGLRLGSAHPARAVASASVRLDGLDWRRPLWETLGRADGRLVSEGRHLHALSPQRTLERGYAVVSAADGSVVRRASSVTAGERLTVKLAEGQMTVRVDNSQEPR